MKRCRGVVVLFFSGVLLCGMSALAMGQAPPLPDSLIARMLSPGLIRLLDHEIASAAFGNKQVVVFELPQGSHWSRLATHILQTANGRLATKADSSILAVGIRDIRFAGDTLVAWLFTETRDLCEDGRWMHTGTEYEARTWRAYGGGWTRLELRPGMTWDGWCIRTPNEELKLAARALEAAGSLRSPAALLMLRRSLTPAR